MHTSDTSASGEAPGRSSVAGSGIDEAEPQVCGAPTRRGKPCVKPAIKDGRCRYHLDEDDEAEALRLIQEAAERHALDADRAIEGGENGDQDAAFNRNARTAAALARTRRAVAKAKEDAARGLEADAVEIPGNERDAAKPDPTET